MTVSNTDLPVKVFSSGTATEYPIPFDYIDDADIVVTLVDASTGAETSQTIDVDYTIVDETVTYSVAPGAAYKVVVQRVTPYTQEASFSAGEAPPLSTYEAAFDKLTMLAQDLDERLGRAPLVPNDTETTGITIPDPASYPGQYLRINSGGTDYEAVNISASLGPINITVLSDYADFSTMISEIGSTEKTVIIDSVGTLAANTVIPATMHLIVQKGGMIVSDSNTITINGPFEAGNFQVFSGFDAGEVTFGSGSVNAIVPQWWGAKGGASTDDTAAIQKAITAAIGSTIRFPLGTYILDTATGDHLLSVTGRLKMVGDFGAFLLYGSAVAGTVDVIKYTPSSVGDEGFELDNIWIYAESGSPARHVINITSGETKGLKKLRITNSLLYSKTGYAIYCDNDASDLNSNGLFAVHISKSEFQGGIYLTNIGDSNTIEDCIFAGANRGIYASMLAAIAPSGASAQFHILRNNITSTGGAILIENGRCIHIEGNNIEQLVDLSADTNPYCIAGSQWDYSSTGVSTIRNNKIAPTDPTSKCGGITLYQCVGTIIDGNEIGTSAKTASSTIAVYLNDCDNVNVHYNNFSLSTNCYGFYTAASSKNCSYLPGKLNQVGVTVCETADLGVGTKGVMKTATYESGWSSYSSAFCDLSFIKDVNNTVHIRGSVKKSSGVGADDVIATLPLGFRPETSTGTTGGQLLFPCAYVNSSSGLGGFVAIRVLDPSVTGSEGDILVRDATADVAFISLDNISFYAPDAP